MKPGPMSFVSLALLVFGGWQQVAALAKTPAFNTALQVEGAGGQRFAGFAPAMYDRAAYTRWIGSGWLAQSAKAEASGDTAGAAEALERTRDIMTEALRHAPGDTTLWMHLARADAGRGEPAAALDGLMRTYEIAPHSLSHAISRMLLLVGFMEDPEARALALGELAPDMIDADLGMISGDRHQAPLAGLLRERFVANGLELSPAPER